MGWKSSYFVASASPRRCGTDGSRYFEMRLLLNSKKPALFFQRDHKSETSQDQVQSITFWEHARKVISAWSIDEGPNSLHAWEKRKRPRRQSRLFSPCDMDLHHRTLPYLKDFTRLKNQTAIRLVQGTAFFLNRPHPGGQLQRFVMPR